MSKRTIATVAGIAAALLVAGTALAGKSTSSLRLVVLQSDGARVVASEPSWGGQITFDVSTTETDRPFVNVRCHQGAAFVYDGWHGFFDAYVPEATYTLSSLSWTGGGADCVARLVAWRNGRERVLTTSSFRVTG